MRTSLVTGGAGFIGSHLVDRLVASGDRVIVVDNLSTGTLGNLSESMDSIEFIESDVETSEVGEHIDRIFHLACVANPRDYAAMQPSVLSSASLGTRRMLDIAERDSSRFYYFSSSEVYGSHPQGEALSETSRSDVRLLTDRSAYLVAKMFGEQLSATARTEGIDSRIVRPFNVYGRRMDRKSPYGRVMVNFVRAARRGEPLVVNGDGLQTRSFCHVDDFIDALLSYDSVDEGVPVVNIGNPVSTRIIDLAETVRGLVGSGSPIVHAPQVPFEPRFGCPDISLIQSITGWSPRISLEDGLSDIIGEEGGAFTPSEL